MIYKDEREHEYMVRESGGRWHVYTRRMHYKEPDRAWHTMIYKSFHWCDSRQEAEGALSEWAELRDMELMEDAERGIAKRPYKRDRGCVSDSN